MEIEETDAQNFAANAAGILRKELTEDRYDVSGNGIVDNSDAFAFLLKASGQLDNISDFSDSLKNSILGENFLDRFSYNGTFSDGLNYRSNRVSIAVEKKEDIIDKVKVTYFVADIFLRDIHCFRTAFAHDGYNRADPVEIMARDNNALIAVSGDFYAVRKRGLVIRNGVVYRDKFSSDRDSCVLFYDGTMETYLCGNEDLDYIVSKDPYQGWSFGPELLDSEGNPKERFNSNVKERNPRCALGYYEPGHYCFVIVDGRRKNYSYGIDMKHLSQLMSDLGCRRAYNMDGGATAVMANATGPINNQTDGSRECSDILYIVDRIDFPPNSTKQFEDDSGEIGEEEP